MAQMGNDTKATAPATKNAKKENPHAGHRQRLKDRFVSEGGLEHFELHNVLEILLFFGIPQKDTNEIAHELIRTFGSFPQVFLADVEQLAAVKGMTRNAAILIKLVPEVYRRYMDESQEKEEILDTTDKIREYLIPKFTGRSEEIVYLLCMNNACKLLRAENYLQRQQKHGSCRFEKTGRNRFSVRSSEYRTRPQSSPRRCKAVNPRYRNHPEDTKGAEPAQYRIFGPFCRCRRYGGFDDGIRPSGYQKHRGDATSPAGWIRRILVERPERFFTE